MKQAVLFDLDGTLLDTTEGILESAVHAARTLGLDVLPRSTMLRFVGPPIQDSFRTFYGCDPVAAQSAADVFRAYYKETALLKARPYPHVIELLDSLRASGLRIGVATYKREDYAITLLEHFDIARRCDVIHGGDNFNRLTKADIIELCIRDMGADKAATVLVGDTVHDAKGAANAGIDFIGVTYGFGFREESDMSDYPSVGCAQTPLEILERIHAPNASSSEVVAKPHAGGPRSVAAASECDACSQLPADSDATERVPPASGSGFAIASSL